VETEKKEKVKKKLMVKHPLVVRVGMDYLSDDKLVRIEKVEVNPIILIVFFYFLLSCRVIEFPKCGIELLEGDNSIGNLIALVVFYKTFLHCS
jgi:hypothetical protein